VLIAQTIAQLRADARQDDAILTSLTDILNAGSKPDWIGDIRVTEIALGDEFPIFSNCRVMPAEDGFWYGPGNAGNEKERLQARMDVDLSDVITIGIETTLNLNWPKPKSAVLPVALAVSIVRFSGTLAVSFIPSSSPASSAAPVSSPKPDTHRSSSPTRPSSSSGAPPHRPTTLAFTFLDDYRLDLSVRSLVGSRSRLQDVPKIAQLIESRVHAWFDERAVEPRFQQIVLPSLWPRKHNTRGGAATAPATDTALEDSDDDEIAVMEGNGTAPPSTSYIPSPIAENVTLEERIEAEGQKLREAEIRAGVRKPSSSADGRDHRADGMRWRGEQQQQQQQRGRQGASGRPKLQSRTTTGIAAGMPGALPR
jgi:maintenance of morphology protein 1